MQGNNKRFCRQQKDVRLAEGLCSLEHRDEGSQSWSSVTIDIKNEVFCFYLSRTSTWCSPGSTVCPAPTLASFMKKKRVCKRGLVNYGKPTAGGSHRLGSCWNYQLLLDKHILLWEPHHMSVLCEMSFPKHLSVRMTTWTLSWPEMAFHICK